MADLSVTTLLEPCGRGNSADDNVWPQDGMSQYLTEVNRLLARATEINFALTVKAGDTGLTPEEQALREVVSQISTLQITSEE